MFVGIDVAAKPSTKCDEIISERSIIAFTDEAYSHGVLQTRKLGQMSILILCKLLFHELIIQMNDKWMLKDMWYSHFGNGVSNRAISIT